MRALRKNAGALALVAGLAAACAAHAQSQSTRSGFDRSVRGQEPISRGQDPIGAETLDRTQVYGQTAPRSTWDDPYDRAWYSDDQMWYSEDSNVRTGRVDQPDDGWFGTDNDWFDDRDDDSWFPKSRRGSADARTGLDYSRRYDRLPGHYPQGTYGIWSDYSGRDGRAAAGLDDQWRTDRGATRADRDRMRSADTENRRYGVGQFDEDLYDQYRQPGRADLLNLQPYDQGSVYGTYDRFDRGWTDQGGTDAGMHRTDQEIGDQSRDARQRRGVGRSGAVRQPGPHEDNYGIWGNYGAGSRNRGITADDKFNDWYDKNR